MFISVFISISQQPISKYNIDLDIAMMWFMWTSFCCCLVVQEVRALLLSSGFKELSETEPWSIKPLDKVGNSVKYMYNNLIWRNGLYTGRLAPLTWRFMPSIRDRIIVCTCTSVPWRNSVSRGGDIGTDFWRQGAEWPLSYRFHTLRQGLYTIQGY